MHRRLFLLSTAALFAAPAVGAETFEVTLTEAEWRARLSDRAYQVLREEETERPNTSPLNAEKRAGTYHCAGCDLPRLLVRPSTTAAPAGPRSGSPCRMPSARARMAGFSDRGPRCTAAAAAAIFGHVFDDGPEPTGLRYCMNGVALKFKPA